MATQTQTDTITETTSTEINHPSFHTLTPEGQWNPLATPDPRSSTLSNLAQTTGHTLGEMLPPNNNNRDNQFENPHDNCPSDDSPSSNTVTRRVSFGDMISNTGSP
jgi:hypothetical protein